MSSLIKTAQRVQRRLCATLDVICEEQTWPCPGERLVLSGETGMFAAKSPQGVGLKGLGLSGFLAGRLWLIGELTGRTQYHDVARRISLLGHSTPESALINETVAATYGVTLGAALTNDPALVEIACLHADEVLSHFHPKVELFPRWSNEVHGLRPTRDKFIGGWREFGDIVFGIDENAGAGGLSWLARYKPEYGEKLVRAQSSLRRWGMIRPDGKVTQGLTCDREGNNVRLTPIQGSERWTRAQAWGTLSSLTAYRVTGDAQFLEEAVQTLQYYVDKHLTADSCVPPWDLGGTPPIARDTCSPAIMACQILRLAAVAPDRAQPFLPLVERTLVELVEDHLTPGGTLLHGCWGVNPVTPASESVLPFGIYFLSELVFRILAPEHRLLRGEVGFL